MDIEEVIANEEDLRELSGRGAILYRFPFKKPFCGEIKMDNYGLPTIVLGEKVVSLVNLDILDLGSVEVVYLSKRGI